MKKCKQCNIVKDFKEFSPAGVYKDKQYYRGECRICNATMQSNNQTAQIKYRNSENGKAKKKAFKQTSTYREQQRLYESTRLINDDLFKLKKRIRDRTTKFIKAQGFKKTSTFAEYIGCTTQKLREHLQSKFTEGMTWETYGHGIGKWTIDHIVPLAIATNESEMYKLCHYTNLQPMWYLDNILKADKVG